MATVDDQQHSPIADQIVSRWMLQPVEVRFVRASANFVCLAQTRHRQGYLRFNLLEQRPKTLINGEMNYLLTLKHKGIRMVGYIPSLIGQQVEKIKTELGTFSAVMFKVMPGEHLALERLDLISFGRWGRLLGEVHQIIEQSTMKDRPTWADHIDQTRQELPPTETAVLAELEAINEKLQSLPQDQASYGVIHYDFELDNLLWHQDQPGIIDCDHCAYYWFVADIAYALRDLFDDRADHVDLTDERFRAFVNGYRSVRTMSEDELQLIPLLLRLHNLVSMGRLYASLGAGPADDEPQWMTDLRQKFHNKLAYYRAGSIPF
jgi:Ser/Thr protein kinase RdoA (MazF antagonist)